VKSYRGPFIVTLAVLVITVTAAVGFVVGQGSAPSEAAASQARSEARDLAFNAAAQRAEAASRRRGRDDGMREGRAAGKAAGTKAGRAAAKKRAAHNDKPVAQTHTTQQSSGDPFGEALAKVSSLGYTVSDTSTYNPESDLHVLIGTRTGSADGYGKQAFFFNGAEYLGTDTSDPSASMAIAWQTPSLVAIKYALYDTDDAFCCPTGSATVRYQWTGSRLTPLDPIPTSENVDGSRL
jgi:LppP/LprE lipoprotein